MLPQSKVWVDLTVGPLGSKGYLLELAERTTALEWIAMEYQKETERMEQLLKRMSPLRARLNTWGRRMKEFIDA